ncbi:MAG: hypothetical protein ACFFDN_51850 [Candidatus Hodarchaeota archaeon]
MGREKLKQVFVIFLVCIGILVGIKMYKYFANRANQEAIKNDIEFIAARAQLWFRTPKNFGGGGHSYHGLTLEKLKLSSKNKNATYQIHIQSKTEFIIIALKNEKHDINNENVKMVAKIGTDGPPKFINVANITMNFNEFFISEFCQSNY